MYFLDPYQSGEIMKIDTHQMIDRTLCGEPLETKKGSSRVTLVTTSEMAVDEFGLTHGGFVFGLADHAAMIAVNHPHVVLASAEVTFTKPVRTGERLEANAEVTEVLGKKQMVLVSIHTKIETVFNGIFTCFTLDAHVLDGR